MYKDEEIKSIKNIARDVAEELEPVKKREHEFKLEIVARDNAIAESTLKMDSMQQ